MSTHMARGASFFARCAFFACLFLLFSRHGCRAQQASYLNVTSIQTQVLPNAIRLTIQTDGTVNFGGDLEDFIDFASGFSPKPVTSFRIRLPRARSRLSAFQSVGKYPIEAAVVSPGRTEFRAPYFSDFSTIYEEPRVDIELRFFVPVTVRRFAVDDDDVIRFGDTLGGRDVAVELSGDKSAIIVTVVPDRADGGGAARVKRSPADKQHHRLKIARLTKSSLTRDALARAVATRTPLATATTAQLVDKSPRFRVDVLHSPLGDVLNAAGRVMDLPFFAGANVADLDVSLLLPFATPDEFVRALENAFDLVVVARSDEGGGYLFAREEALQVERLPLFNLSPDRARLLLPDFLLPFLRADRENNALVVAASPRLVKRLKEDLAILDRPRAQVRVEVSAWEFASSDDAILALRAARTTSSGAQSFYSESGSIALSIESGGVSRFAATVQALKERGRARLKVAPFVVVANGERGTVFLGQTRFVNVIQQRNGQNEARAINLQIGYTLGVTPRLGASRDITLDLNPRFSTIDAIEAGSGLPTIGIREASATIRLRDGDAVLVGGLDTDLDFDTRRRLFAASSRSKNTTTLLLMVSARRV